MGKITAAHGAPGADRPLLSLPEEDWPEADRSCFEAAFRQTRDLFDDTGGGYRLTPRTKSAIWYSYRGWLGWIARQHAPLLAVSPDSRVTPDLVKHYVRDLRIGCSERTTAARVSELLTALRYMYPERDWSWLKTLKARLERAIPKRSRAPILLTSQVLIDTALRRLHEVDQTFVIAAAKPSRGRHEDLALRYRDGLLVALAGFFPLRRRNIADLMIGTTIRSCPTGWSIELSGDLVKNGEPISAELPPWIGDRLDRFIEVYRPQIHGSSTHMGLWASVRGCPANGQALYEAFQREVQAALGIYLTLHDARRIAGTTWAVHDPVNAAGVKDLLGDRSDRVMTQHYIVAGSIEASRASATTIENVRMRLRGNTQRIRAAHNAGRNTATGDLAPCRQDRGLLHPSQITDRGSHDSPRNA